MNQVSQSPTDVGQTAKEHASQVTDEVKAETRHLVGEIRQRLAEEANTQSDRLSSSLRQLSEDLSGMRARSGNNSLASEVVQRLSEGSRQIADHLERRGPDGMMREVQDFARRKPGTFLLSAAFAGFVMGRLGKGIVTDGSGTTNGARSYQGQSDATTTVTPSAVPTAAPVGGTGAIVPPPVPTPAVPQSMSSRQQPW